MECRTCVAGSGVAVVLPVRVWLLHPVWYVPFKIGLCIAAEDMGYTSIRWLNTGADHEAIIRVPQVEVTQGLLLIFIMLSAHLRHSYYIHREKSWTKRVWGREYVSKSHRHYESHAPILCWKILGMHVAQFFLLPLSTLRTNNDLLTVHRPILKELLQAWNSNKIKDNSHCLPHEYRGSTTSYKCYVMNSSS